MNGGEILALLVTYPKVTFWRAIVIRLRLWLAGAPVLHARYKGRELRLLVALEDFDREFDEYCAPDGVVIVRGISA